MMLLSSTLGAGLVLALVGSPRAINLDAPPLLVAAQVKALMAGGLERERVDWVCSRLELLPYLRQYLKRNPSEVKSPGAPAVKLALATRILDRSGAWVKEGRADLLMEAGVCVAPLDEVTTVKLVNRMYELLRSRLETLHPLPPGDLEHFYGCTPLAQLKEKKVWGAEFAHGDRVPIGKRDIRAAFGREVDAGSHDVRGVVYASKGIPMTWPPGSLNWCGLFVSGGAVELPGLRGALIIADGDVVLPETDVCNYSLVVATGSISGKALNTSLSHCHLYAGGDIRVSGTLEVRSGVVRAGGKVICTNANPEKIASHVNGFDFDAVGLKFFKAEEIGLTLGGRAKTVTVQSLTERSPLRPVLRVGDLLRHINGREVITRDDARRAFREATVLEYAVVALKRGDEELTRLVLLPAPLPKK